MFFVYFRFRGSIWQGYSPEKRLKVLQALEKKMAKKQGRPMVKVEVWPDPEWASLGMFEVRGNNKTLYINEKLVWNHQLRFFAMETIIHEGRHAFQYYVITNKKLRWYNFKEKRWRDNWAGYIPSSENEAAYNVQAVERDAQSFTLKMLKSLAYKYRNEEAFKATLRANQERYEQSEFDARREFGPFYKHKINKRIKNKSKR